jgi:hypothetical protein
MLRSAHVMPQIAGLKYAMICIVVNVAVPTTIEKICNITNTSQDCCKIENIKELNQFLIVFICLTLSCIDTPLLHW